jgi:hypothetical protein
VNVNAIYQQLSFLEFPYYETTVGGVNMKSRLIIVAVCLLVVMSHVAVAQTPRASRAIATAESPSLPHTVTTASHSDEVIKRLSVSQPPLPLGPVDVLRAYEDGMTLIAQRLSAELTSISQANRVNQITRDEADYLIQDRYQVAMMQRQVLSALHDSLQHDLAQAEKQPDRDSQSDTAVVVVRLPLAEKGRTQQRGSRQGQCPCANPQMIFTF